jgi:hypothetical protein
MASMKFGQAKALDELQSKLRPRLLELGFRVRKRTSNRSTADGLIQVVQFQLGRFDPTGTYQIPGLRENLYGRFTVNVGVYVPEVGQAMGFTPSFVHEVDCCVRARLGQLAPNRTDIWWGLQWIDQAAAEAWQRLERDALPFLERFHSRDAILKELMRGKSPYSPRPLVECAIILANRGQQTDARSLLTMQALEAKSAKHTEYLRELAVKLGLGQLEI